MAPTIPYPANPPCWKKRGCWVNCTSKAGRQNAPSFIAPGTARSQAFSAQSSGSRLTLTTCENMRSPMSTPTAVRADFFPLEAHRIYKPSSVRSRTTSLTPRRRFPFSSAHIFTPSWKPKMPKRRENSVSATTLFSGLWATVPTSPLFKTSPGSHPSTLATATRTKALNTIPFTTIFTGIPTSPTRISSTGERRPKPQAQLSSGLPIPTCFPSTTLPKQKPSLSTNPNSKSC